MEEKKYKSKSKQKVVELDDNYYMLCELLTKILNQMRKTWGQ